MNTENRLSKRKTTVIIIEHVDNPTKKFNSYNLVKANCAGTQWSIGRMLIMLRMLS